jgi:putative hydrolase of the HAD superfamily
MPVSFLWFDIGYTLLYMQREPAYQKALRELGYRFDLDTLRLAFHLADKHFMREFPGVFGNGRYSPAPWFLGVLNYRLGVRADLCALASRWHELQGEFQPYWVPYETVIPALEELKRRGLRLGVISNWDPSARSLLARHGLERFFEQVVLSSEVGFEKPRPEIFQKALERAGVAAADCLYIGDNYYDDAKGSRQAGMGCLIVNPFGRQGVEEIRDVPILSDVGQVPRYLDDPSAFAPGS